MSNIALPASLESAKVDTYTRTDGVDTVHVQAMVPVNPIAATAGSLSAAAQSVTATGLGDMDGVLVTTRGTFSGTLAFEASQDGTNWYAVLMNRASSATQESTRALTGTTLEGWRANLAGWSQFRVRCSAYTSGTASISIAATSMAFDPPASTVAATQSGTWTVQPGNTANTTAWLVRPQETLGTATALGALNATIAGALNGSLSVGMAITAVSSPTGITLTPQVSYDGGTNYVNTKFYDPILENIEDNIPNASIAVGFSRSILIDGGVTHVRVVATAWTSGSATVRLSSSNALGLVALKSGALHDSASGSYLQMVGGVASSTAPTAVSANGDAVKLWATTSGALNVADGGSSLTVDGTVAATQSGTWTVQPGNTANTTPWLVTNRGSVFFNDSTTALAGAATFTGTARDVGIAAGTIQPYGAFNATAFADQAGTLRIEMSNDNTTWRRATADTAVAANAVVTLSVPVVTRYYRAVYVNGATLQGAFMLNSSFTGD